MGHEQDEFADFYRASRDSCLQAVTAVVSDRQLAEELVAEAFARAWAPGCAWTCRWKTSSQGAAHGTVAGFRG
jgi:DNA-directed RNA polymerase specialized sigma24 family protein